MTAESEVLGHDVSGREMTNEEKVLRRIKEAGEDGITAQRLRKDLEISVSDTSNIIAGLEFKKLIKLRKEGIEWYWCAVDVPEPAAPGDDDRVACPVRGCRARIKNQRENLGNHLNIAHGGMPPRDRVVMLDRMYPRPPSPTLEDLKAEMEAEDEKEPETDRLAGYMEKVDQGEISKPPAGSNMDNGTKLPKKPKKSKAKGPSKHESPIQKRDHAQEAKNKLASKAERVATAERIACPIDGCKSRPIREKSNVRAHLRAFHKLPLVEIHARLEQIFGAEGGEESNAVQSPATEPAVEPVQDVQEEMEYTELPTKLPTEQPAGELAEVSIDHTPEPEALPERKETIDPDDGDVTPHPAPVHLDGAEVYIESPPGSELLPPNGPVEPGSDWQRPAVSCGHCIDSKEDCVPTSIPPLCWRPKETLAGNLSSDSDCNTIALPRSPTADLVTEIAEKTVRPKPVDPFAELVRRHRVRVGREISKLKRLERKLRRRAAAAESMADRIKVARRTKEKELDRFEREVVEVKGQ
ncbi:MAG: hypothetical protein LLG45_13155 [Actinomycetia bacterium]|nr:hypothetical protein [Actinomycetes bacterium]